jgi:hypothetical protein
LDVAKKSSISLPAHHQVRALYWMDLRLNVVTLFNSYTTVTNSMYSINSIAIVIQSLK